MSRDQIHSDEELKEMLTKMRKASDQFYFQARLVGCHPFIEFTGLMNEWLKVADGALEAGVDFANANEHSGIPMPIKGYQADYLGEKFACIFGPTFRANPKAWRVFADKVMKP